jgi:hypothetical protein
MRERPEVMPPVALKVRRTSAVLEYVTSIARFRCSSVRSPATAFFSGLSFTLPTLVAHTLGLGWLRSNAGGLSSVWGCTEYDAMWVVSSSRQSIPSVADRESKSKNAKRNIVSVYGVSVPCSTKLSFRSMWVVAGLGSFVPSRLIWPYPLTTEPLQSTARPACKRGLYSVTLLTTRSMNTLPTLPTLDLRKVCEGASVSGPRPPRLLHAHASSSPVMSMEVSSSDVASMQGGALGGGSVGGGGGLGKGATGGGDGDGCEGGGGSGEGGGGEGGGCEGDGDGDGGKGEGDGGEGDGEGDSGEGDGDGGEGGNEGGEGGEGGADGDAARM